ncbi:hypothetical protein BDP27DRAFT_1366011 [Rhodocollybia butyracea]|uniref:Uncharacterized protein n=1 Tax=Rhodocollybia butyracea TaxID=206335 RepID=A0A9P5U5M5_9AGAR|nr:hypothetical protein BDP27DRAFT_1366011 [Rhodocollybia butyracea]
MHSKLLLSAVLAYSAIVNAIPAATTSAPQASVTLYAIKPSGALIRSGSTTELDITVVGVSTGSAGTETTYSIGEYISLPATTISSGPVLPSQVQIQNFSLVESSAGAAFSLSDVQWDSIVLKE